MFPVRTLDLLFEAEARNLTPDEVVDVRTALDASAPVIRTDLDGKTDNHIFDWETGDAAATDAVFAKADVVVKQEIVYPRVHPAPMETCGAVADLDPVTGKLSADFTMMVGGRMTLYASYQAGQSGHISRCASTSAEGTGEASPSSRADRASLQVPQSMPT